MTADNQNSKTSDNEISDSKTSNIKTPKSNRTHKIMIRLDDDEFKFVKQQADEFNLLLAVYARYCLVKKTIADKTTIKLSHKYMNQMAWIGNNINQIARAINTLKLQDQDDKINLIELNLKLDEMTRELAILRQMIQDDKDSR